MRQGLGAVWLGCAGLAAAAGCGDGGTAMVVEERPLEQAAALEVIQQALQERGVSSERFVPVTLPGGREWAVDVAGSGFAVAYEYVSGQDFERVGELLPIPATPDETPRAIVVRRVGVEGDAGKLYLRVFSERHFRYQPNPPSDLPDAPYTIREVQARLRRDVRDFAAWFAENHGSGVVR